MISTTLVIFGGTGDLAERKIFPALFDLFQGNLLPDNFRVVGISRKEKSNEEYREFVRDAIEKKNRANDNKKLEIFLENIFYLSSDFQAKESYQKISENLIESDKKFGQCSNKLFYLAVPPELYDPIFQNIFDSGLSVPCSDESGWTRILVEKPFGNDLATAKKLESKLGLLFSENQIFRIDHYLAKETLQNILAFRFSNALFEPLWNRDYIKRIDIKLLEKEGIGARGAFYDGVGALRDVGQNHVLQMLAFVAMEDPKKLKVEEVRKNRSRVFEALRPLDQGGAKKLVTRGQYRGYLEEKNVSPNSQTETYFKIGAYIDNNRWQGVPFVLESGKKMPENLTEISIYFKETESCLCPPEQELHHQNTLTFHIQPKEGISLLFWSKKPGFNMELEPRELSFEYGSPGEKKVLPDAYERVLYDCIQGDQTLFSSSEEIEASWKFITSILDNWQVLPLEIY